MGRDELERRLTDIHHQRHGGLTCLRVTDVKETSSRRATARPGAKRESDHIKAGGETGGWTVMFVGGRLGFNLIFVT